MNKDKEVILGTNKNTDKEIYRETEGDFYSPSIHVTENGSIGICVGGTVIVKSMEGWHKSAEMLAERVATTREIHNMICGDVPHSIDDCEHASEIVKALTKEYVILRRGK